MPVRATIVSTALVSFGYAEEHIRARRQDDLGSTINSLTSVAGSAYSYATGKAASYYSEGLSVASVDGQEVLSGASGVFATATSVGEVVESIVTSLGGPAITLAMNGGVITSFAGSEYTVVSSATSTANAAVDVRCMSLAASPMLTMLVTVVSGALLGAWLTN